MRHIQEVAGHCEKRPDYRLRFTKLDVWKPWCTEGNWQRDLEAGETLLRTKAKHMKKCIDLAHHHLFSEAGFLKSSLQRCVKRTCISQVTEAIASLLWAQHQPLGGAMAVQENWLFLGMQRLSLRHGGMSHSHLPCLTAAPLTKGRHSNPSLWNHGLMCSLFY